ncbi:hypothetical protein GUITHDRAFT_76179 [Guillardia theta CCMP2712]|uniref:VTT domain-containing protein n=1 Tax=Guillardia theta (strain CCMP2712) TaxID=905079 RepID=L1IU34_GUITC|nr:hypothetical protein GUITHDRAFT_76179 [Guillardia theta CCMP2712]EKX39748.1 hypothetical protein GUITHDRAFT_76179 [Guillardia theta CCMP2712]|eukprot:XP_005826728.1 hypothetical protein GUITHDRAFT_76179 [Guillardia theta CCMP2712]
MLGEYKTKHYWAILIGFAMAYLIKMVLALPGSPLFNLLGGALFGVPVGFIVCMACTSIGTALCYVFFQTFGGPVVRWLLLEQLVRLDEAVRHHRRRLFYYLTVIRIFPITPNFFINLAAPLIRLPLVPHVASATIGLAPITFLTVQAGMTLSSLESLKVSSSQSCCSRLTHAAQDAVDRRILITLGGLAIFASIPLLFRSFSSCDLPLPHCSTGGALRGLLRACPTPSQVWTSSSALSSSDPRCISCCSRGSPG